MHHNHQARDGSNFPEAEPSHATYTGHVPSQGEEHPHHEPAAVSAARATHSPHDHAPRGHTPAMTAHTRHEVDGHADHDKHVGHTPEMFRNRFWLSLMLTLPILYFDMHFQEWFSYRAVQFPAVRWVQPLLSVALYLYGGGVFVQGAWREFKARQPGMMTLIGLAVSVAFFYSWRCPLGFCKACRSTGSSPR